MQPVFDYRLLRKKISEECHTEQNFAKKLGIGRTSLSQRLNNKAEFSQTEMVDASSILNFSVEDIPKYFFTLDV